MTFSKLDFIDRLEEDRIKKMWVFLDKNFSSVKREIKYLPKKMKHGVHDSRTVIKHYDTQSVSNGIDLLLNTGSKRAATYKELWNEYKDIVNSLEEKL